MQAENILTAEAHVKTEKASKYLKWLCGHFNIKARAEYNDQHGTIDFDFGHCEMDAEDGELIMRVQAADDVSLDRVKHVVGDHLERFGYKESIQVAWKDA